MVFDEEGQRVDDLKVILSRAVNAAMLFDDDGISIRFMKWYPGKTNPEMTKGIKLDNISSEEYLNMIISNVEFSGITPLGTSLQQRILKPMVLDQISGGGLKKPVLIITITDGRPTGEEGSNDRALHDAISKAAAACSRSRYGAGAVSFQIAQVGNDRHAIDWLAKLDSDPEIGHLVDCTSSKLSCQSIRI